MSTVFLLSLAVNTRFFVLSWSQFLIVLSEILKVWQKIVLQTLILHLDVIRIWAFSSWLFCVWSFCLGSFQPKLSCIVAFLVTKCKREDECSEIKPILFVITYITQTNQVYQRWGKKDRKKKSYCVNEVSEMSLSTVKGLNDISKISI